MDDFEIGSRLGKGRFGKVFLARERKTDFLVALKVISKSEIIKTGMENQLKSEIENQSHLKHKNIIRLYGYFWDDKRIFLIVEYAQGGKIFNKNRRIVQVPPEE